MHILIVKTSSLGDIVQSFPALHHIRACYPDATIHWVVEEPFADLVESHPFVDQVIRVHTKKWRSSLFNKASFQSIRSFIQILRTIKYDYVVDLQSNSKSGLICLLTRAKKKVGFGTASVHEWPNLLFTTVKFDPPLGKNIRDDYLFLVQSLFPQSPLKNQSIQLKITPSEELKVENILRHEKMIGAGPKIMICPGSIWENKQIDREVLQQFLELLAERLDAHFLFIWGSEKEKRFAQELEGQFPDRSLVVEKLKLQVLQNLMSKVDRVFSMDSLPLHLAGTTSTSTMSVFGPSLADKYKPIGSHHVAYQGKCPYGKTFEKRCPILRSCSTASCIKKIDADELFRCFIDQSR